MSQNKTKCQNCGKVIAYPAERAGTSGRCPSCKAVIDLPAVVADQQAFLESQPLLDTPAAPITTQVLSDPLPREPEPRLYPGLPLLPWLDSGTPDNPFPHARSYARSLKYLSTVVGAYAFIRFIATTPDWFGRSQTEWMIVKIFGLLIIGACFLTVVFAELILVLLAIEKNTRKE